MPGRRLLVTTPAAALVVLAGGCTATPPPPAGGLPQPAAGASWTPAAPSTPAPTARSAVAATATRLSGQQPTAAGTARPGEIPAATLPPYSSSVHRIDQVLAYRMRNSWRPGCPVPLSALRYLRMTYYGFDGAAHSGEMVVHADQVSAVTTVFRRLYDSRFPIYRMRLVDDYGGSDAAAMDADDSSAFNCRPTTGGTSWSQHSYGRAIDLNPIQNPYVAGGAVQPAAGSAHLTRWPLRKGMIGPMVRAAFAHAGWYWGGNWRSPTDYMHFSANNR
jgi:D-alanyl-D-alanine carboxypeptidase